MGVITLALIAYGSWTDVRLHPVLGQGRLRLAIAAGTYLGGWRVIRTLGKGLVEIASPQGMAAEASSAAIILSSSHLGHGAVDHPRGHRLDPRHRARQEGRRGPLGRRRPDGRRLGDHPAGRRPRRCGLLGLANAIGGGVGIGVVFAILIAAAALMFRRSRRTAISPHNVNAEWEGGLAPAEQPRPSRRRLSLKESDMEILTKALGALWQVAAVGLLLGAGLPALFALGVRSLNSAGCRSSAERCRDRHLGQPAGPGRRRASASASASWPCCSVSWSSSSASNCSE